MEIVLSVPNPDMRPKQKGPLPLLGSLWSQLLGPQSIARSSVIWREKVPKIEVESAMQNFISF